MDSSKSERRGLEDGSESCCDVRPGDGGTNKRTGGRAGSDSVELKMLRF